MDGITKCLGIGCDVASNCHRFTSKRNADNNNIIINAPSEIGKECVYYISNLKTKI